MTADINEIKAMCENLTTDELVEKYERYLIGAYMIYITRVGMDSLEYYRNMRDTLKAELLKRLGEAEE